ncbi:MAG TPA: DMT family transporter [Acidimicrobiia bacterium]|nr:DMT family transporter [Acidimicrobiia bacterium]
MRTLVVLAAIVCGVAVAIQAQFTGAMQRQIGTLESTFITYFSGGLIIALVTLAARGGNLAAARSLPWYVWSAGVLGLVIIFTLSLSVGQIGLVPALVIITVSQFVVGAVINHFGLLGAAINPMDFSKLLGFVLLGAGTFFVLR